MTFQKIWSIIKTDSRKMEFKKGGESMEKLIYTIRWIINSKGLKQKAVAERMGITDKKLSEMLNGRKKI